MTTWHLEFGYYGCGCEPECCGVYLWSASGHVFTFEEPSRSDDPVEWARREFDRHIQPGDEIRVDEDFHLGCPECGRLD